MSRSPVRPIEHGDLIRASSSNEADILPVHYRIFQIGADHALLLIPFVS